MRINEIFYSLQGEGRFTGTPAVFIRFAGCNMACDFCDTDHEPFIEMTVREVVDAVVAFPARHIVITGGEPTLQLTDELLDALHARDKFVQIETNGSIAPNPETLSKIDWTTVSPKNGNSLKIPRIDELKVIFDCQNTALIEKLENVATSANENYYLQPCDRDDTDYNRKNLDGCIEYIKNNPKWKLSVQLHKMLGMR